jgi:hypothetical protein
LWVFGGFDDGYSVMTKRSFAYSTVDASWREIASIPMGADLSGITHAGQAVDPLTNIIYLVGGIQLKTGVTWPNADAARSIYAYSTQANMWLPTDFLPQLPAARGGGAAVVLGRYLHYYGGGSFEAGSDFTADHDDHWALNMDRPQDGWSTLAPLSVARNHLGGVAVDGKLFAIGGQLLHDEWEGNYDVVEAYDPLTDTWTTKTPLPRALGHITPGVFSYGDNGFFVVGGTANRPDKDSLSLIYYDVQSDSWFKQEAMTPFPSQVAGVVGNTIVVQVGSFAYTGKITMVAASEADIN